MLDDSPCCEGCGYDLSHQPSDGRCPECGLAVAVSVLPWRRRTFCDWGNRGHRATWWATTAAVLLAPRRFYTALCVRMPGLAARRFARRHYLAVGTATAVWVFCLGLSDDLLGDEEYLFFCCVVSLVVPLLGWVTHRGVGAVAATGWIWSGTLRDFRPARKVLAYETTYLWVFCLYNGLLITSLIQDSGWMVGVFSGFTYRLVGLSPEVAAFAFGNGALCLVWLWRFRTAIRAVRWANF